MVCCAAVRLWSRTASEQFAPYGISKSDEIFVCCNSTDVNFDGIDDALCFTRCNPQIEPFVCGNSSTEPWGTSCRKKSADVFSCTAVLICDGLGKCIGYPLQDTVTALVTDLKLAAFVLLGGICASAMVIILVSVAISTTARLRQTPNANRH